VIGGGELIVAQPAWLDLADLNRAHSLPTSTRERVRRSMSPVVTFPLLGPALTGRWQGFRSILGPWPWMLMVTMCDNDADLVIIVTIEDTRSRSAPRFIR
jgi:hypothetical protein